MLVWEDVPLPTTVKDMIPSGSIVNIVAPPGLNCTSSGQLISCTKSSGFVGQSSISFDVYVSSIDPALPNCAQVFNAGDINLANNKGCDFYPP